MQNGRPTFVASQSYCRLTLLTFPAFARSASSEEVQMLDSGCMLGAQNKTLAASGCTLNS